MESLPPEVLHIVFSSFCSHCQGVTPIFRADDTKIIAYYKAATNPKIDKPIHYHRQTLCNLSRVSRQLRQIAQPILHHQFDILLRSPIAEPQSWRLEPFLRTITVRPDLARVVTYLNTGPDMVTQLDIKEARRVYLEALKTLGVGVDKVLAKRAENTNQDLEIPRPMPFEFAEYDFNGSVFKDRYMFLKQFLLETCESSACTPPLKEVATTELMMVLLALLPNLETLVINDNFFEGSMMSTALETFGVRSLNLKSVVSIQFPYGIVRLSPQLQSMIIGDVKKPIRIPHAGSLFYWGYVVLRSNRIAAKEYHVIPKMFEVHGTHPLTSFGYVSGWNRKDCIKPRRLVRLLVEHRPTLQSLYLHYWELYYQRMGPIASLKAFVALKDLSISTNLLYSPVDLETHDANYLVHFLPHSIQSLTLIDTYQETGDFLYTILKHGLQKLAVARSTFSCLKKIRCDLEYSKYDKDTKQTFGLLGVDFVYERFQWKTGVEMLGTVEWPFGREDTPESFLDPRERDWRN
ncbi:hypothetical protein NW752_011984 [Fusarium irregulare]|uniref:F-box domain-containing protein n=1 Tax=Fusarium irregulare TaxID=2494466 RepID=A0A9W8PGQ4_9HYPO|nr:hypothetical protein NW752_011984 [Fusarium irregulare]KAJ4006412.1 hypothetical protein NW766_010499 [Fusarium irregulare]